MKRVQEAKNSRYYIQFKNIELYKEDLEDIVSLFETSNIDYRLTVNCYELENISELEKLSKKTRSVFLIKTRSFTSYLEIELTRGHVSISLDPVNDITLSGITFNVESIVENRTNKFLQFFTSLLWPPLIYVILVTLHVLFVYLNLTYKIINISFNPLFKWQLYWVLISIQIWKILYHYNNNCVLFLTSKQEKENFFVRNKDSIVISLISTVVGTYIGTLISKYFLQPIHLQLGIGHDCT